MAALLLNAFGIVCLATGHRAPRAPDAIKFDEFMDLARSSLPSSFAQVSDKPDQLEGKTFIRESSKEDTLKAWLGSDGGDPKQDVPNLVHLIHVSDKAPTWHYFNHLHVNAALKKFNPDNLYIYYHSEPEGEHWQQTINLPGVKRVHIDKALYSTFQGHPVHVGAHHADKLRLMTLLKHGGLYLDTDVLSLKDIKPLRTAEARSDKACAVVGEEPGGIGNSLIASTPNCKFLRLWWQNYTDFDDKQWGEHSIIRPGKIAQDHPELLKKMPMSAFTPFYPGGGSSGRNAPKLFQENAKEASADMPQINKILFGQGSFLQGRSTHETALEGPFTMHLFGQYNNEALSTVTEEGRCRDDTVYNMLTRLSTPCSS